MSGALAGFRILDLSEDISGPYGAKLLSDLGADVIKVEAPGRGDRARIAGPFPSDLPSINASGRFLAMNLGKRGITLDVTTPSGRDLLRRLIDTADALIHSVPPNPLARSGIDEDVRSDSWPALVVTAVSGLGMGGPDSGRTETELTLASRSSWIYGFGEPDREPLAYPGKQISLMAGVQVALATLAGLLAAERDGTGQWIDISQVETNTMAFDQDLLGSAFVPGRKRGRIGRLQLRFPPRLFVVADGYVSLLITDNQWPRFCRMCGFEDFAADPELRTQSGRAARMEELEATFVPWFLERTKAEVVRRGQSLGVPIAPFNTIAELLRDPHFVARGSFVDIETEGGNATTMPGRPFVLTGTPWSVRRPAPALGEHNGEIFSGELGLSPGALVALSNAGVI